LTDVAETRRYDLQVHTDASPCSGSSPSAVVDAVIRAGLDGIAVTDHDTVANVAAVRDAAPPDLHVVSGAEVTTTEGHLLALGVDTAPQRGSPLEVIRRVHDQGGVAVLSHPFDSARQTYERNLPALARAVDGIEGVNSRCVLARFNRQAQAFAKAHSLPATGGSDAHFPMEIGRAVTVVRGDVLDAIREGRVEPHGRGRYLSGHVATKLHQVRTMVSL